MSETKLPKRFVILRDADNPIWDKYIKWLNGYCDTDFDGDNPSYYGSDNRLARLIEPFENHLANYAILTLDQWDAIVNPKEYQVAFIADKPNNNNMKSINQLCTEVHQNAKDKGFYEDKKNIGEMLALIHSEVSEALEADRKGKYYGSEIPAFLTDKENKNFIFDYPQFVKGTFEEEMADIVIRVFDMCGYKGIDLQTHVEMKMRYNSLREHKHGKKY